MKHIGHLSLKAIDQRITNFNVHNLSQIPLTIPQIKALALSPKFIPKTSQNKDEILKELRSNFRKIRIVDFFKNKKESIPPPFLIKNPNWNPPRASVEIESNIIKIEEEISKEIENAKKFKPNLSKQSLSDLKQLRNNPSILILPTDKNCGLAICDKKQVIQVTQDYLQDENNFVINNNPDIYQHLVSYIKSQLEELTNPRTFPFLSKNLQSLTQFIMENFKKPNFFNFPYLRMIPKVHKPTLSWRPIVGAFNTPLTNVSKYLAEVFKYYMNSKETILKNSSNLILHLNSNKIKKRITNQKTWLITGDVTTLYPKMNLQLTMDILCSLIPKAIKLLPKDFPLLPIPMIKCFIQIILFRSYTEFNGKTYKQKTGIAMGNNLSVAAANLYMLNNEKRIKNILSKFITYRRYIDDYFLIYQGDSKDELDKLLLKFNQPDSNIQINWEISNEQVNFLDIQIRLENNQFLTKLYCKPSNVYQYIPFQSFHCINTHKGWIYAEILRIFKLTSQKRDFIISTQLFYNNLRSRGFPPNFINPIFFKWNYEKIEENTMINLLTNKTKTKNEKIILKFTNSPFLNNINPMKMFERYLPNINIMIAWKNAPSLSHLIYKKISKEEDNTNSNKNLEKTQ